MLISAVSMSGVIPTVKNSQKSNSNYASTAPTHDTFRKSNVSFGSFGKFLAELFETEAEMKARKSKEALMFYFPRLKARAKEAGISLDNCEHSWEGFWKLQKTVELEVELKPEARAKGIRIKANDDYDSLRAKLGKDVKKGVSESSGGSSDNHGPSVYDTDWINYVGY